MLNTQALALVVLEKKIFSHYKPVADTDAPGAWSMWTPGTWLTGFMKGTTKHSYIQSMYEALVVSKKKIFLYIFSPL